MRTKLGRGVALSVVAVLLSAPVVYGGDGSVADDDHDDDPHDRPGGIGR